jgi:hypothetical protein
LESPGLAPGIVRLVSTHAGAALPPELAEPVSRLTVAIQKVGKLRFRGLTGISGDL